MTPDDVIPLHLADVTYPASHPLAGQDGVVLAFAIRHPDGIVLVDTGVGQGDAWVDENYRPRVREGHTVVEWVDFPDARYEAVEGDREIVEGVSVLATPGHTPGHQSVTVRAGDGLVLIVGQAAQDARSFATGEADASVRRLRELNADRIHFSHDRAVLRRRK